MNTVGDLQGGIEQAERCLAIRSFNWASQAKVTTGGAWKYLFSNREAS